MKDIASVREYLLVLRCQTGDERAFADLFNRFGPRTLRHLEGLLGHDAAQDARTRNRRFADRVPEEMLLSKQIEELD